MLRAHFPKGRRGRRKARALLGHRTAQALATRATRLGLVRPGRRWTQREDRTLLIEWGDNVPRTLCDKLRGRSWSSICRRADELGLGPPQQDMQSLGSVARRLGYCAATLRGILARHGVEVESYHGGNCAKGGRKVTPWRVDPVAAEEAVRAELAERAADRREKLTDAAARHGLTPGQMETRLARLGLLPREAPGCTRWVQPEDADRAAALEVRVGAATGGLAAACREAGVSINAAHRVLREHGWGVRKGKRIAPHIVARVIAELTRPGVARCVEAHVLSVAS